MCGEDFRCACEAAAFGSHQRGTGEGAEEREVGGWELFHVQRIAGDGGEEAVERGVLYRVDSSGFRFLSDSRE